MSKFDAIRPFYDAEVNQAIVESLHHPMMKALMNFTFPETEDAIWMEQLRKTHSIRDFQCNFIYHSIQKVLEKTTTESTEPTTTSVTVNPVPGETITTTRTKTITQTKRVIRSDPEYDVTEFKTGCFCTVM